MEPTLTPEGGFLRLRIDFAYDGTDFAGWAKQPDQRTVQNEMESALEGLTRSPITIIAAGRTDAGVHASHQVAHCDIPQRDHEGNLWDLRDIEYRLNRILDEDIRIHSITFAPDNFHARFSAIRRHYIYKIADAQQQIAPLARRDISSWYRALDLDLLNQASALLLGKHDFASFCKAGGSGTTIRTLEVFSWQRQANGFLHADVIADAFCYSMVRNLVGSVASVAEGRFPITWISELLEKRTRVSESLVFPARGLTLFSVEYPPQG